MIPVLHEALKAHLVLVGVMNNHQRHAAGCADRRNTIRCRPAIAMVVTLSLLAAACGSAQSTDSAGTTPPVSQQSDDIVSGTVETLQATEAPGDDVNASGHDDNDVPDYTPAELEVLLNGPQTEEDKLDPREPEPLHADSPAAAIEEIEAELDDPTGAAVGATPILDKVEPLDAPTGPVFGIRDGRRINEAGEAILLDDAAALACANVEIALTALDEGRSADAAGHLRTASNMAADTEVSAMSPWSSILEQAAVDVTTGHTSLNSEPNSPGPNGAVSNGAVSNGAVSALLAFVTTCTQGGYEL